jgi:FAD/FMN-containing dehydrogenase
MSAALPAAESGNPVSGVSSAPPTQSRCETTTDCGVPQPLPGTSIERVESFGMNRSAVEYVWRPSLLDDLKQVFETARSHGRKIGLRGAGRTYGDGSLSSENICLDLTRMNRILGWNPKTGVIELEPGVTVRQLWQYCIGDGWWPPVVSGTMFVTMGGALAMNFHGKNNFRMGPIGDHVIEFDLFTPSGETLTCTRIINSELFYAAIGGFGMLGCFTRIVLQMKHVESGLLEVYALAVGSIGEMIREFEARMDSADYLVGWIDCFARGGKLGRGQIHEAHYLHSADDPDPSQTLRVESQDLPDTILGIFPKSIMWRILAPISNNFGMRLLNWAKYKASATIGNKKTVRQSHAGFAFLLDYVPNWKYVYRPNGFIQYQSFIPAENAERCFTAQLTECHKCGVVPYLGVFKRHRRDGFLMTHGVDGYSLALDIPITTRNSERLKALTQQLNTIVIECGGRFYFAKDSTLDPTTARAYLGEKAVAEFTKLKRLHDPENLLQTDLSKRLFGDFEAVRS